MELKRQVLRIEAMPFLISLNDEFGNKGDIPDRLPFTLNLDEETGLLVQRYEQQQADHLASAYARGSLLGTAMDDSLIGRRYAEDFLVFLKEHLRTLAGRSILEVGAGRGYLLRLLADNKANCLGLEPGIENAPHWQRHGVRVLPHTFPHPNTNDKYDCIIAFLVIEHIWDLAPFLSAVTSQLKEGGTFFLAVPDCTPYIAAGDPSILIHEHFSYYTSKTLKRILSSHGFTLKCVRTSDVGGNLYAAATVGSSARCEPPSRSELLQAAEYGRRCEAFQTAIRNRIDLLSEQRKTLGIYCAGRAINVLPHTVNCRFFDDDENIYGKYYPGFAIPIENREDLLRDSVDELWIMSRSFGAKIRANLLAAPQMRNTDIKSVEELT